MAEGDALLRDPEILQSSTVVLRAPHTSPVQTLQCLQRTGTVVHVRSKDASYVLVPALNKLTRMGGKLTNKYN